MQAFTSWKGSNPLKVWQKSLGSLSIGASVMNLHHFPPPPLMEIADPMQQPQLNGSLPKKRKKDSYRDADEQNLSHFISCSGGIDEMVWQVMQCSPFQSELEEAARRFGLIGDIGEEIGSESAAVADESPDGRQKQPRVFPKELSEFLAFNKHILQPTVKPSKDLSVLGKRGRPYQDVWAEEDFVRQRKGASNSLLSPMPSPSSLAAYVVYKDWSKLFHDYRDDFDGQYMEKMVAHLERIRKRYNITGIGEFNNEGSYWNVNGNGKRKGRAVSMSSFSADDNESGLSPRGPSFGSSPSEEVDAQLQRICDPPVPVTCVHPASWYLTERSCKYLNRTPIDINRKFEFLHPASIPHKSSKSLCQAPPPSTACEGVSSENVTAATRDFDELDLELDKLLQEQTMLELSNICRFNQLRFAVENGARLEALRKRRECFEADLLAIHAKMKTLRGLHRLKPNLGEAVQSSSSSSSSSSPSPRDPALRISLSTDSYDSNQSPRYVPMDV